MKSPISYYGRKSLMVNTLIPLIPNHKTYVEPFVGGGSLFFAKHPSDVEVINDLNGFVAAFYRTIKTNYEALNELVQNTIHDENTFKKCRDIYRSRIECSDLDKAYALWVGANMSFGGSVYEGGFQITTNSKDKCKKYLTITLPDALTCLGRKYEISRYAGSTGTITVQGSAGNN